MYYLHTFYLKYLLKMTDGIAIMYNLSDFYLPVYSYSFPCHVIAIRALRNLSQQTGEWCGARCTELSNWTKFIILKFFRFEKPNVCFC